MRCIWGEGKKEDTPVEVARLSEEIADQRHDGGEKVEVLGVRRYNERHVGVVEVGGEDADEEDEEEATDRPRVRVASLGEEGEVLRRGWKCEETVCEGGVLRVRRRKRRCLREGEQNGDEKVQLLVCQGGVVIQQV